MCIRDRINNVVIVADQNITDSNLADTISYYFESPYPILTADEPIFDIRYMTPKQVLTQPYTCLLYTSDAADERSSVDLGGRRIIKKKTK